MPEDASDFLLGRHAGLAASLKSMGSLRRMTAMSLKGGAAETGFIRKPG